MTATRREAIQLLERVPEDKLTYVVQILSSIDGLISISDRRTKKIDLDQFVMPTTERGRNADEYKYKRFFIMCIEKNIHVVTSAITVEEYLIYSE